MPKHKRPDPIDVHVGTRVRMRRMELGLSQQKLAEHLGVTFQQTQKQEQGKNRISASALFKIARALQCDTAYFYDGIGSEPTPTVDLVREALSTRNGIRLCTAYTRITDPKVQERFVHLAEAVAGEAIPAR